MVSPGISKRLVLSKGKEDFLENLGVFQDSVQKRCETQILLFKFIVFG